MAYHTVNTDPSTNDISTLENALDSLTVTTEAPVTKRLRSSTLKTSLNANVPDATDPDLEDIPTNRHTNLRVPPHFTPTQWRAWVRPATGVSAEELISKIGITAQNVDEFRDMVRYKLEQSGGRYYLKGDAPRGPRVSGVLTQEKIERFLVKVGEKGMRLSELVQKAGIKRGGMAGVLRVVREIAVVRNGRVYAREFAGETLRVVNAGSGDEESEFEGEEYDSGGLGVEVLRREHEGMQQCIDELRRRIVQQRSTIVARNQKVELMLRDRFNASAEGLRQAYQGALIGTSEIRVKIIVRSLVAEEKEEEDGEIQEAAVDDRRRRHGWWWFRRRSRRRRRHHGRRQRSNP